MEGALLPTTFVVEDSTVKLVGGAMNDLGNIRIAPTIDAEDLRVVLQWEPINENGPGHPVHIPQAES